MGWGSIRLLVRFSFSFLLSTFCFFLPTFLPSSLFPFFALLCFRFASDMFFFLMSSLLSFCWFRVLTFDSIFHFLSLLPQPSHVSYSLSLFSSYLSCPSFPYLSPQEILLRIPAPISCLSIYVHPSTSSLLSSPFSFFVLFSSSQIFFISPPFYIT